MGFHISFHSPAIYTDPCTVDCWKDRCRWATGSSSYSGKITDPTQPWVLVLHSSSQLSDGLPQDSTHAQLVMVSPGISGGFVAILQFDSWPDHSVCAECRRMAVAGQIRCLELLDYCHTINNACRSTAFCNSFAKDDLGVFFKELSVAA